MGKRYAALCDRSARRLKCERWNERVASASSRHMIVRLVGARHVLTVPTRRDGKHINRDLRAIGGDSGVVAARARRLGGRGCKEQRQHQSGNGEQTAHETQRQDFRMGSHERSNRERQVLMTA